MTDDQFSYADRLDFTALVSPKIIAVWMATILLWLPVFAGPTSESAFLMIAGFFGIVFFLMPIISVAKGLADFGLNDVASMAITIGLIAAFGLFLGRNGVRAQRPNRVMISGVLLISATAAPIALFVAGSAWNSGWN